MSVSTDQDCLAELERQLRSDLQDLALAHRWLNQLERSPPNLRDRPFVADMLLEIARRFPADRRLVAILEERWLAAGRGFAGREKVEDWYRDFLRHTSEPPGELSGLGVLAVPAITRALRGDSTHHRDGCMQALYRMGTAGSSAFEDLLELADHCSDSWCYHEALFEIEPNADRAVRRLQAFQLENPKVSLVPIFRGRWNHPLGAAQNPKSYWLAALAAACKMSASERANLDSRLFSGSWGLEEKLLDATILAQIANIVGDQPLYLRYLWRHWHRISMSRRQPIIDALRKLYRESPRLQDSVLDAFSRGLITPSRLKNWPWTRFRGALRVIPALERASRFDFERRYCAQALAALTQDQAHRLRNERDFEKLRPITARALELARSLAKDPCASTSALALRALSRLASSPHSDQHPENHRLLRAAILSGDPRRIRAASTTGLWPLSHEDLRALQSQSSKRRKPLRRALRRVLDKADALVSSPVQQAGPMLESGDS